MKLAIKAASLALLLAAAPHVSNAQRLFAMEHIQGFICMRLNLNEQQAMDPSVRVPLLTAPSPLAPVGGIAGFTVAMRVGRVINGYAEVVPPDWRRGKLWVAYSALTPWSVPTNPNARCHPSVMSNGMVGFDYQ